MSFGFFFYILIFCYGFLFLSKKVWIFVIVVVDMDPLLPVARRTRQSYDMYYKELFRKRKEEKEKNIVCDLESGCARTEEKMAEKRKNGNGSEKLESSSIKDSESVASADGVQNSHLGFERAEESGVIDVDSSDVELVVSVNDQDLDSDSGSGSKSLVGKKGGELCVPQQTGSQINVTSGKEKIEPGSSSLPFCIDDDEEDEMESSSPDSEDGESSSTEKNDDEDSDAEDDLESSSTEDDDDDEDFNVYETKHLVEKTNHPRKKARFYYDVDTDENDHQVVRKIGFDKEKCVYDSRKNKEYVKKRLDDDELELEKSKKKKKIGVNVKKNDDIAKILLDTILKRKEADLAELFHSRNKAPQAETNQFGDETVLPLKFTFGVEEPNPTEISDSDKELERLWAECAFALRSCEIGSSQLVRRTNLTTF